MVRASLACVVVPALAAGGWIAVGSGRPAAPDRTLHTRPHLAPPPGYACELHDGPDFYVWVMREINQDGAPPRAGVGIHAGRHPNVPPAAGSAGTVAGWVADREVVWQLGPGEAGVRRDAVLGTGLNKLHVWVWGPSEEVVAGLADQLVGLEFRVR